MKYVFALFCVVLAVLVRVALDPMLSENQLVLSFFYIAVLATSWFGELGPAIFCSILGFLTTDWFFLSPRFFGIGTASGLLSAISYFSVTLPIIFFGYLKHKSEVKLRESEERFKVISDHSPVAVIVFRNNKLLYVNPVTVSLLEYSRKELLAMDFMELIHPDSRTIVRERAKKRMSGDRKPYRYEIKVITKSGREKWLDLSSDLISYEGLQAGIVICIDITERKQAEEILKRDKDVFEYLVKKRTRELLEAQTSLERAKRLSDIGTLASTVAHELRNPLAAISIASHNLGRKTEDFSLKKHLCTIEKKVAESEQIINNLLFYSKIKPPHFESENIFNAIKESVRLAKATLSNKISIEMEADVFKNAVIEVDPLQLKEILDNIINNATDAVSNSENGKIKISGSEDTDWVGISIIDNGVGMSKETIGRVMEPFYSTKSKGTGLGLTVSKQIVEMHNGSITLESEEGRGTTVIIRLPKKQNQKEED